MKLALFVASLFVCGTVMGQSADDIYRISFKNRASGTARSAAMGGAFTSLGADASSMNINPAGMGMYRSSELSLTPSLFFGRVNSVAFDDKMSLSTKNNNSSVNLNNISAIFSLYNSQSTTMRTFTLGVSYYNERYSKTVGQSEAPSSNISIGDYFSAQLYGLKPSQISNEDMSNPKDVYMGYSPNMWGAIMAYNAGLLEPLETDGKFSYRIAEVSFSGKDGVLPTQHVRNTIKTDNISFAMGTSLGDVVYLGMTLGARTFDRTTESTYFEDKVTGNKGDYDGMRYYQSHKYSGSAFDFKIGATVEPVRGLKVGLAYHAPTISFIDDEYYSDMDIHYSTGTPTLSEVAPYDLISYKVKSAPSLLAGISYVLPYAIISFDYQRTWYNKMEFRDRDSQEFNRELASTYRPADSFMAGVEVQPTKGFFVRGGYAYYSSPYQYKGDHKFDATSNISFGLGYRTRIFSADLAYINSTYKTMPFRYFGGYFVDPQNTNNDVFVASESKVEQKFSENTISLTLGLRF